MCCLLIVDHPSFFFWEIVEICRRVVLIGWVEMIPERLSFIRIVVGVLISLAFLLMVTSLGPYCQGDDHMLAVANHFLLCVLFVGAG